MRISAVHESDVTKLEFQSLKCPYCMEMDMQLESTLASHYPYIHNDTMLICPNCEGICLFGIPKDAKAGLTLNIWSHDKREAILHLASYLGNYSKPKCVIHEKEMWTTKYVGKGFSGAQNEVIIQSKCPECFLTDHKRYKIDGHKLRYITDEPGDN